VGARNSGLDSAASAPATNRCAGRSAESAAPRHAPDDTDGDGASNVYEFLAGTDPMDSSSVLKTMMLAGIHGYRLQWNAQPGAVYEVQRSLDFSSWEKISNPRLALDSVDSVSLNQIGTTGYFRVVRLR